MRCTGDPLGGRLIWTQSTELRFPLPISADLGLSGRAFVDIGGLTEVSFLNSNVCVEPNGSPGIVASAAPRVGIGVGMSWKTPFGLINIDLTPVVVKQRYDRPRSSALVFGTRF